MEIILQVGVTISVDITIVVGLVGIGAISLLERIRHAITIGIGHGLSLIVGAIAPRLIG